MSLFDVIGLFGVVLSIYCYGRVQWQRDFAKQTSYSVLNFVGSVAMMISLTQNWNLASFISNTVWGILSVYGVYRCLRYSRAKRPSLVVSPVKE